MSRKHFIVLGLFLAAGLLFLNVSTVKAVTFTWTGGGDGHTWIDPGNWGNVGVNNYPGATTTDAVIIGLNTNKTVPTIYATTSLGFGLSSLTLGAVNIGPILVIGNGATLNASTTIMVVGTSTLSLGNGSCDSGALRLGNGNTGAVPLSLPAAVNFDAATGTVTYIGTGGNIAIATATFYNLTLTPTSTAQTSTFYIGYPGLKATTTIAAGGKLITNTGSQINGNGAVLRFTGTGTVWQTPSFASNGSRVVFDGAGATNISAASFANILLNSAQTFTLVGSISATGTLEIGPAATLVGSTYTITLSGSGTPFKKPNGIFTANSSTVVYSATPATIIATATYSGLNITGAATELLGDTTATSTVTVASGAVLDLNGKTITVNATGATWTNNGTVTRNSGSIIHTSASAFTDSSGNAKSFFSENNGDSVYLTVTDTSLNFDASTAESVTGTATISASSDTSSAETVTLTETGIKTGIFRSGARLASISSNFSGILECFGSVTLSALFSDSQETDTSTPSSATGLCANGGGGGGSSSGGGTTVATTATTQTTTTTAASTTPVVTTTPTATAVSTLESVQSKVTSVIAKIASLPTNPTTSDLASIQAEIAAILIELQSIQAAQPTPQGVALGFNFVRPLALGLRHADVSNLQKALKTDSSVYPEGLVTGYFGPMTLKAVQKFQEKYNIASSGKAGYGNVGPATRAKLNALYGSK